MARLPTSNHQAVEQILPEQVEVKVHEEPYARNLIVENPSDENFFETCPLKIL